MILIWLDALGNAIVVKLEVVRPWDLCKRSHMVVWCTIGLVHGVC